MLSVIVPGKSLDAWTCLAKRCDYVRVVRRIVLHPPASNYLVVERADCQCVCCDGGHEPLFRTASCRSRYYM